jgi:hypothetical protein
MIERQAIADADFDPWTLQFLEAGQLRHHVVDARRQEHQIV